jgi:hypothetical protein
MRWQSRRFFGPNIPPSDLQIHPPRGVEVMVALPNWRRSAANG